MKNSDQGSKQVGRREALQLFGVGITAAGGMLVLGASPAFAGEGPNCKAQIEVDEAGTALRRSNQYKEKAPNKDKVCTLCSQYEAGTYGQCGGCKVLPGAVNPEGSCLSFAPKK
jgi:hypothetical protein